VLEDNTWLARRLAEVIRTRLNVQCWWTSFPSVALRRLKNKRVELVIQDLYLPDVPRFDLIPKFRSQGLRVLIITGKHTLEVKQKCLKLGAQLYIPKPFTLEEFVDELKSILSVASGSVPWSLEGIKEAVDKFNFRITPKDEYLLYHALRFGAIDKRSMLRYFNIKPGNLRVVLYRLNNKLKMAGIPLFFRGTYTDKIQAVWGKSRNSKYGGN